MKEIISEKAHGHIESSYARPRAKIPNRSRDASYNMLDLTAYFNFSLDDEIHHKPGNTLSALPKGIQDFDGVKFDVRGVVQLEGAISLEKTTLLYPRSITDIKVNLSCHAIHFLHSSAWNDDRGRCIGEYLVHYQNGEVANIPLVYGENVMDWWGQPNETGVMPVWTGENPRTKEIGFFLRVFKYSWKNPKPEIEITSIDLISKMVNSAPILLAITVE